LIKKLNLVLHWVWKRKGLDLVLAGKPMHRTTDTGIKIIHDSEAENTELY